MIPPRLRINGRQWKVVYGVPDDGGRGECDYATRTITLSVTLDTQDTEETFVHELLHALLPEGDRLWPEKTEELVVELLAPRLLKTLKGMGCWRTK